MSKSFTLIFILTTLLLFGCSDTSSPQKESTTSANDTYSITDFADRTIELEHAPERIAALSNGEMDIIYALGGELVGRPNGVSHVEATNDVTQIGSTHEIDLEQLTLAQPDVVLGHAQMNLKDIGTIEGLGAEFVLTQAQSIEDIQNQIQLFGEMLQKEDKAAELLATMDEQIKQIQANQPEHKTRVLLVYGAPGTYMAALPNSLSGHLLEVAGGENIASDFEQLEAYPQYAQLNTERVIEANPEYILLMSHGNSEEVKKGFLKEMEQNATWNNLEAVKQGRIEVLPSDLFGSNPGTRVTEALEILAQLFAETSGHSAQ
ncbi:ABC transporter substrate-binding protein [Alkalihalobacillus pseudalcaliphilus]|uniref:ABC transporter substrate-binding protein n=1 Tax=Alkalihalobacillus pseudalcaliphilus TaxID=79884 RepID=UPI00064DFC8A|nr:iron-hydroxamate ABC transporter substrate-binding protein [Alkalihalobacillus pseudalcaliphilus]